MKDFIELKQWEILMVVSFFFLFLCGAFLIIVSIFEIINLFFEIFLISFVFGVGFAWFSGYIVVEECKILYNDYKYFKLNKK